MYGLGAADITGTIVGQSGPDPLDAAGLLALQGGESGPNLNPGIDLSPGTVAADVAGGVPLNTKLAAMLGTSGSTANTVMLAGAGVGILALALFLSKGGRRR